MEISYPGFADAIEEFITPKRAPASTPVIGSLSLTPAEE
jgi:hypothetical protein